MQKYIFSLKQPNKIDKILLFINKLTYTILPVWGSFVSTRGIFSNLFSWVSARIGN